MFGIVMRLGVLFVKSVLVFWCLIILIFLDSFEYV